ncbi:hypothetical protein GCK32_003676 [Trichostrongylus colubriformis]|uniref:Uncharacterized protein n=1 Tax=Trichostrongylus colubriformis TaxID=6319 RepID=A0AAN8FVI8_TRICO
MDEDFKTLLIDSDDEEITEGADTPQSLLAAVQDSSEDDSDSDGLDGRFEQSPRRLSQLSKAYTALVDAKKWVEVCRDLVKLSDEPRLQAAAL